MISPTNKPDAVNPAIAPRFQVERHWRGVMDSFQVLVGRLGIWNVRRGCAHRQTLLLRDPRHQVETLRI